MFKEKYLDRSNYFRGLLVLVGKDRKIKFQEASMIMRIGQRLGFAVDFCKTAIRELLENENISSEPPKFFDKNTAIEFMNDGIELALVDKNLHQFEIKWLKSIAKINMMNWNWCKEKIKFLIKKNNSQTDKLLSE